jgi:hypothetical protein
MVEKKNIVVCDRRPEQEFTALAYRTTLSLLRLGTLVEIRAVIPHLG